MTHETTSSTPNRPNRFWRWAGITVIALLALVLFFAAIAYVGWQRGSAERAQQAEARLREDIGRQLDLVDADLTVGRANLALNRLAWVLENDPQNERAGALQATAIAQRDVRRLATPTVTPTPPPTATPFSTPEDDLSAEIDDPARQLNNLQQRVESGNVADAIPDIIAFQFAFPEYERLQSDTILFEAYVKHGTALIDANRIELGLTQLEYARQLGPLPQEAQDRIVWAEIYQNALSYMDIDYPIAISYLQDLCFVAPFFNNACDRLAGALIAHGDQLAAVLEWCPAAERYSEAQRYRNDSGLTLKLRSAREQCALATPTPTPTETVNATPEGTLTPTPGP